jgi:MSHA biogenesis protein MshJ
MTFDRLNEKFLAFSIRERLLIVSAVLVALFLLLFQLSVAPVLEKKNKLQAATDNQAMMIAELSTKKAELTAVLADDPNNRLKNQNQVLRANAAELNLSLRNKVETLLSPKQTQNLLIVLLADYKGLELVSAMSLGVDVLDFETGNDEPVNETAAAADDTTEIYEHGFEMTFRGSYFEAMQYIARLEEMSGFYWKQMHYTVIDYPEAEIFLSISTLSVEEAWIGG